MFATRARRLAPGRLNRREVSLDNLVFCISFD
jgi:hypothetical protein